MDTSLPLIPIRNIQGGSLNSPYAGQFLRTRGLVTGVLRRGFYVQTPGVDWDGLQSDGLFVYSPEWQPSHDAYLELSGKVIDYSKHETAKPVTQLHFEEVRVLNARDSAGESQRVEKVIVTPELIAGNHAELSAKLNSLEGMLLELPAGQTFIAPSNPFGDYVVALDADQPLTTLRSPEGGVLLSADNPDQWYPGFRVYNYNHAQRLNVGAKLLSPVSGPLHYRVDAWQMVVNTPFEIEPSFINQRASRLTPQVGSVTIMTLNCFNLDPHIEAADKVSNPRQDIDDDWGEGRFHTLAQAVALQANCPDIVALQEIQDNDGAEQTEVVSADVTYSLLVKSIHQLSGTEYRWVDIDPKLGADGGQPGGNIRNGYLYNPDRVELLESSVKVLGSEHAAFVDSRKPLLATFKELGSGEKIACINVHLASKRHQNSIFAPLNPGVDGKLSIRVQQAQVIAEAARGLLNSGMQFYITGDFNDTEHSETLAALESDFARNLVMLLPNHERYDYNHRGKLQVLMHGLVSQAMAAERAEYEIIHGNELIGVQPGEQSDKPSDHAYVIARLNLHRD